jgi:hypothetical protein
VITKSEWIDWKSNPVTQAFYQACAIRTEDAKAILGNTAGIDPIQDNYMRGFIAAYFEMEDFKIEDLEDED